MADKPEEMYLIWNKRDERDGWYDHCMVFFAPKSCGYVNTVDKAGRYTLEEAISITKSTHGELKMVAESKVLKAAKTITIVKREDLKPRNRVSKTFRRIEAELAAKREAHAKAS